jgi:hypothetical protein
MRPLASEPNKADLIPDELVEAGKITPVIEGLSAKRGSCRRTGGLCEWHPSGKIVIILWAERHPDLPKEHEHGTS